MNYQVIHNAYTPNNFEIDVIINDKKESFYALKFKQGTIGYNNNILPGYNIPQAEILFSNDLTFVLCAALGTIEDALEWEDPLREMAFYTESEYNRKLNGYTALRLNRRRG